MRKWLVASVIAGVVGTIIAFISISQEYRWHETVIGRIVDILSAPSWIIGFIIVMAYDIERIRIFLLIAFLFWFCLVWFIYLAFYHQARCKTDKRR